MNSDSYKNFFSEWGKICTSSSSNDTVPNSLAGDSRFKDPAWNNTPYGNLMLSWYEMVNNSSQQFADLGQELSPHQKHVWDFYIKNVIDAISPSNFLLTNPQALQKAFETSGQSLTTGAARMLQDISNNALPSSSDMQAFAVGSNLATTSGSVVYQNELFQLIQYKPLAAKVFSHPLLIVPPCVNKYYAFDLNEQKSFVLYLLERGYNVFIISWRNPHPNGVSRSWDDYVFDGVHKAVNIACEIGNSPKLNLLSWCIGGALTASAIGVMTSREKERLGSATFLTTLMDYSEHGDIGVFIDEPQINAVQPRVRLKGVMPGKDLAAAMAMLHAKESIWNFYVNNYLLGEDIYPFDVLYWNSDTANVPADLYQYYVENMYLKNLMRVPGALKLRDRKLDLGNIDIRTCFVSATDDHIVPWKATLISLNLVSGPCEFLLTEGGHVSGTVINHPAKSRKNYWFNGPKTTNPDAWKKGATMKQGSWWLEWCKWLSKSSGKLTVAPKTLGNEDWPPLEAAPGSYALEKVPQS